MTGAGIDQHVTVPATLLIGAHVPERDAAAAESRDMGAVGVGSLNRVKRPRGAQMRAQIPQNTDTAQIGAEITAPSGCLGRSARRAAL